MLMTMRVVIVMMLAGEFPRLLVAIHHGVDDGPEHIGLRRNMAGQKSGEPGKNDRLAGNGIGAGAIRCGGGVAERPG